MKKYMIIITLFIQITHCMKRDIRKIDTYVYEQVKRPVNENKSQEHQAVDQKTAPSLIKQASITTALYLYNPVLPSIWGEHPKT